MNTNHKSLLVIDSPYILYVYSLMNRTDIIDILVLTGENYSNQEFGKLISYVIPAKKVGNITYCKKNFNWNFKRNSFTVTLVKETLETYSIHKKKIESYNYIYLNSYGSAIGFYLSTIRPYIAIQHSPMDIVRHLPIKYFFESTKFYIKTKKIRYRYSDYCIANSLKSKPKKFSYHEPFSTILNDEFYRSFDINKTFTEKDKGIGILLWTNHYSYDDPFNIDFIKLNLKIFKIAYKNYGKNLDLLIIKLHHRISRPDKTQLAMIISSFEKFKVKIVLFDQIFNYEIPSRIYPIEMFVEIFNASFVAGTCTSAIWNSSNKLTCKTYSALEYQNQKVGRLQLVINGLKVINKKLKYKPTDLSISLNESN